MVRDVEFIFMGTGTSAGVPVIACDCRVCRSDDPRDTRTRTGACLRFTDPDGSPRVTLFDTTPDLREQALRHDLQRCDAILYTHNHVDHTFGLDEVRRFNAVMKSPIDVYADAHTMRTLFRIYTHIFEKHRNVNDSFVATLMPQVIEPENPIDLHGLRFTPLRLLHGNLPVLGFRVDPTAGEGVSAGGTSGVETSGVETSGGETSGGGVEIWGGGGGGVLPLAYCTDVSRIPPETWPKLEGLETLVLDMLRYRHHPTHMTVDQAVDAAGRIGARRTWFTHMTHDILHAELDAELPEGMAMAYDGLVVR